MTKTNALYVALKRLREADGTLPASALTPSQKRALEVFGQQTRSIKWVTAGRGSRFCVVDAVVLENHWRTLCPVEPEELSEAWPDRARNIAGYRNSKFGVSRHEQAYVFLKSVTNKAVTNKVVAGGTLSGVDTDVTIADEGVTWRNGSVTLDLEQATREVGVAALMLLPDDAWHSHQPLWLVENQALFDVTDWFPPGVPAASLLYYAGHLPNRLLDWLGELPRAPEVVIFPDYDGVGLINYARLYAKLAGRCRFWLMPNWRTQLARFGNAELWRKTRSEFEQAKTLLADVLKEPAGHELAQLMEAMQQQGLALEQESVWL